MVPMTLYRMIAVVQEYPLANEPFDGLTIQEPYTKGHQHYTGDEEVKEIFSHGYSISSS